MWDLIVSVPDHFLSFYFLQYMFLGGNCFHKHFVEKKKNKTKKQCVGFLELLLYFFFVLKTTAQEFEQCVKNVLKID